MPHFAATFPKAGEHMHQQRVELAYTFEAFVQPAAACASLLVAFDVALHGVMYTIHWRVRCACGGNELLRCGSVCSQQHMTWDLQRPMRALLAASGGHLHILIHAHPRRPTPHVSEQGQRHRRHIYQPANQQQQQHPSIPDHRHQPSHTRQRHPDSSFCGTSSS